MNVIKWERQKYGGSRGTIADGRITVAHIGWGLVRHVDKPWTLRSTLPGFTAERRAESEEEAQKMAEKLLANFVRYATPKEA